ncbi:HxlR family transcriptional regulator [Saccharothrix saharensis]|uniref:HxlR family transcriptional regulator n=1 Tax=Saccharothrix saharensis TaxID=571190 RepID=A0A543J5F6_9PSEU|nr:HxlR family transcriptional regulator [Saccharothrix saharensis]
MFLADCPARTTLEVVGHTWSVVVVVALGDGPLRYGELLDRIGGISNKMLTQTLARLRSNGLLTSDDGWHTLTALGHSLLTPVRALAAWAEEHTGDLLDARHAAATHPTTDRTPNPTASDPSQPDPSQPDHDRLDATGPTDPRPIHHSGTRPAAQRHHTQADPLDIRQHAMGSGAAAG